VMISQEWETPDNFFELLDAEFHFDIDVCATASNTKCFEYYSIEDNGLMQPWQGVCWMNPPYKSVGAWTNKAYSAAKNGATVVGLLRASIDTKWWHAYIMRAQEIRFIADRLWFKLNGISQRANHPSVIVIWEPGLPCGEMRVRSITNGRRGA